MLSDEARSVASRLLAARGSSFTELVRLAGLNPATDFRGADLAGVDFGTCILAGFDFSDADLRFARLDAADVRGAILDGANLEGTVFGSSAGLARKAARAPVAPNGMLAPHQAAALEILRARLSEPHGRVLVSMPSGTGKFAVVRELLAGLLQTKDFHLGLVLSDTAAQREQMFAMLSREFGDVVVQRTQGTEISFHSPRIVVGSVGQFSSLRQNYRYRDFMLPIEAVSHLIFPDFAPCSAPSLVPLADTFHDARVAAITSISPKMGVGAGRALNALFKVFKEFHFIYDVNAAVADGWLRPSRILRRTPSTDVGFLSGQKVGTTLNVEALTSAVRQFSDDISMGETTAGSRVLICNNLETASFSSDLVNRWLENNAFAAQTGLTRTLAISSYSFDRNMANALLDTPGTLLCMTSAIAGSVDWSRVSFVGLLARVDDTLAQELEFTPVHRHSREPLVVFDYVGSLTSPNGMFLKELTSGGSH